MSAQFTGTSHSELLIRFKFDLKIKLHNKFLFFPCVRFRLHSNGPDIKVSRLKTYVETKEQEKKS